MGRFLRWLRRVLGLSCRHEWLEPVSVVLDWEIWNRKENRTEYLPVNTVKIPCRWCHVCQFQPQVVEPKS